MRVPLYLELYNKLKDEIISNYKIGDKLPSIRKIAELYNVSKTTAENAYSQLYAEGYIDSKPKSGYFVSDFKIDIKSSQKKEIQKQTDKKEYKYDFFPAHLDGKDFPLKIWKRLQNRAINSNIDFGSYGDGQGEEELREEIAKYLNIFRGTKCTANEIIITHGFSDSMALLAKIIKDKYSIFAIEYPSYHIARRIFDEYGYKVEFIKIEDSGINLKELTKSRAKLVYITPSHQYPTGVIMPISKRVKLIKHMQKVGGLIIEDDYDSELKYNTRPIPSLQGLGSDVVVYLGTFAKVLSPAIRVGYMVLPTSLMPLFKASYEANFASVSKLTQKTLSIFMKEGYFDRHLRKIRKINKNKHNLLLTLLKEHLKDSYKIITSGGGLAVLIMPTVPFDFDKFKTLAEQNGIKLYFAKDIREGEFEAIRLGFGGFSLEKLEEAILELSKIWYNSLK